MVGWRQLAPVFGESQIFSGTGKKPASPASNLRFKRKLKWRAVPLNSGAYITLLFLPGNAAVNRIVGNDITNIAIIALL